MSNYIYGTEPDDPTDPTDPTGPVPTFSERTDADTVDAVADDVVSARARAQRRLAQARISAWDAAARARVATSARRTAPPADDTGEITTVSTLTERAQAYRGHIMSVAGAAVIALLVAIMRRRGARQHTDTAIDLGNWQLRAEPTEPGNYEVTPVRS